MIQSALVGGLFIGVLSALPVVSLGNCCCLWMVGGGFLAVHLEYQNGATSIAPSRGLWIGALAGIVGAVVWFPVSLAVAAVMGPLQERLAGAFASPDMPAGARGWLEALAGPFLYALGFAFQLVIGTAAAAIGGLLGTAWFRKDLPPAIGGAAPPPLPPDLGGLR